MPRTEWNINVDVLAALQGHPPDGIGSRWSSRGWRLLARGDVEHIVVFGRAAGPADSGVAALGILILQRLVLVSRIMNCQFIAAFLSDSAERPRGRSTGVFRRDVSPEEAPVAEGADEASIDVSAGVSNGRFDWQR